MDQNVTAEDFSVFGVPVNAVTYELAQDTLARERARLHRLQSYVGNDGINQGELAAGIMKAETSVALVADVASKLIPAELAN